MGLFGKKKGEEDLEELEKQNLTAIELIAARRRSEAAAMDPIPTIQEDEDLPAVINIGTLGAPGTPGIPGAPGAPGAPDPANLDDPIPPGSGPVPLPVNGAAEADVEEALDADLLDIFEDEVVVNEELATLARLLPDIDIDKLRLEVQEVKRLLAHK
ncbi:MAG: hypothetical protein O2913_08490 [Chloroflexi bacterium]|nr:hypothetical protein [Chloroflexota bacterium]